MGNVRASCLYGDLFKKIWPLYRGRRAGKLVKLRETQRRYTIRSIQQPRAINRATTTTSSFPSLLRSHNPANCINITPMAKSTEISRRKGSERVFVPSFLLSNVQSLAPKIDEIQHCINNANLDLACLTETWLKEHIQDTVVAINGYNLIRLDRRSTDHGGVCMYIKNSIKYSVLQVLWVKIQPTRLPRGISTIVVGVLYHPPCADNASMLNYLIEKLTSIESQYTNCGVIVLGDFNHLRHVINKVNHIFNLKQIVPFATRGSNKLDLILTNLQNFYNTPVKRPNFGLSDHATVEVQPKQRVPTSQRAVYCQKKRSASKQPFGYATIPPTSRRIKPPRDCEDLRGESLTT